MRKALWIGLVVVGLLGTSARAQSFSPTGTTQPRLSVFEGYFNPG